MTNSNKLLEKIKNTRLIQGINQEKIANFLKISVPTYSRFERGITKTDYELVLKSCSFLNINLYDWEDAILQEKHNQVNEDSEAYSTKNTNIVLTKNNEQQLIELKRLIENQLKINKKMLKMLNQIKLV